MNVPLPSYNAHNIIKYSASAAQIYTNLIVMWLRKHYDKFSIMKTKLLCSKS